jgi:Fe-S-cluster containining protein
MMTVSAPGLAPLTRKEALWLACKQKACCYASIVIPTGRDIWRISRALDAPPWSFLVYFRPPYPRADMFYLDHSGQGYRLALAKQPSRRTKSPPPCIFLLRTRDGHHRCGLGELRPLVCRAFPAELVSGVLCLRHDSGCACRRWSLADVDINDEIALVQARQTEFEEYCAVVTRWNALVATTAPDAGFTFFDYCTFLLDAYDELAAQTAAKDRP